MGLTIDSVNIQPIHYVEKNNGSVSRTLTAPTARSRIGDMCRKFSKIPIPPGAVVSCHQGATYTTADHPSGDHRAC